LLLEISLPETEFFFGEDPNSVGLGLIFLFTSSDHTQTRIENNSQEINKYNKRIRETEKKKKKKKKGEKKQWPNRATVNLERE
jgi:hypothetical protein